MATKKKESRKSTIPAAKSPAAGSGPKPVPARRPRRRPNHEDPKGVRVLKLLTYLSGNQGKWIPKAQIDRFMNYEPQHFRRDKDTLEAGYLDCKITVDKESTSTKVLFQKVSRLKVDHLRTLTDQLTLLFNTSFIPEHGAGDKTGIDAKPFPALKMPAESFQVLIKTIIEARTVKMIYNGETVRTLLYAMTIRDQKFYAFGAGDENLVTKYYRLDRIEKIEPCGDADISARQAALEREFRVGIEQVRTHLAGRLAKAHNLLADLTEVEPEIIEVKARFYMDRYKIDDFQGDFTVVASHPKVRGLAEHHDLELRFTSFLEGWRFFNEKLGRFSFLEKNTFTDDYQKKLAGALERTTSPRVNPRRPKVVPNP